jgi:hypothetical protein
MEENSLYYSLLIYSITNGTANYAIIKKEQKQILDNFNNYYLPKTNKPFKKNDIPDEIKKDIALIKEKVNNENLYNLYNNLTNIKIKNDLSLLLKLIKGKYNSKTNTITYTTINSRFHELMHLASSCYDEKNNIWLSGFINYNNKPIYGKALNEGYTELITRRVFNKKTAFYNEEVKIVSFFELLFDKNALESHYFNNDIYSFINHIDSYIGKENAIKLLLQFDYGFNLKIQGNPLYKLVYTNLELKLCKIFKLHNKSLLKQVDYFKLLDMTLITKTYQKTKQFIAS